MARVAAPWPLDLSDALALHNVDVLRHLLDRLETPKPRPTRKADMIRAIGGRLTGDSLRRLWDRLGEIQKSAVSEVLHGPEHEFSPEQFEAKYGALPADLGSEAPRGTVPLRLFLYPEDRYTSGLRIIPVDLAERLLAFVPPPAEATLAVRDELPEAVEQRRRDHYLAEGEKPTFDRVELVRRDMEHSALRDLPTVMRLVAHGRVAVSATTRRPSAAGMLRIAEVLDGGDFYDPGMKKEKPWEQVIGPIRAFAWPMLLQAAKLAEPQGSKLALTKAGHAVLAKPPEETLRRLWERWLRNTLLDEFSRVDDIKGQQSGKGRRAMTAAANRRPAVVEALRHCPVGRWVHFDEFSRFMQASSLTFDVTRDPWRLYLVDTRYGSLGVRRLPRLVHRPGPVSPLPGVRVRRHARPRRRGLRRPGRRALGLLVDVGRRGDGVSQPLRRSPVLPADPARRLVPGSRGDLGVEPPGGPHLAHRVPRPAAARERFPVAG